MKKKQLIRLTEGDLHRIIKESVKNILKESQELTLDNNWDELVAKIKKRLSNGEDPHDIFDYVGKFYDGFARVELNNKWNFLNTRGQLLTNQWFDYVEYFNEGFVLVCIKGKGWNFINTEGQLLTNQWFDKAGTFYNGFALVSIEGKRKKIDKNGNIYEIKK